MAVHAEPRATVDINLLIPEASWEGVREVGQALGFIVEALPMNFGKGSVRIRRITKLDSESTDHLILHAIIVSPELEDAWQGRLRAQWEDGEYFSIVSREGLIKMKLLRGSAQDLADIEKLRGRPNQL